VTADISNSLCLLLLSQLISFQLFFLLLLELEPLRGCLKLSLVDHKEVAGSSLREVGLSQDVLNSSDGADLTFFIDVL